MFFSNTDMPKLHSDNAEKLESPITEGEIRKAVSIMKPGNHRVMMVFRQNIIKSISIFLLQFCRRYIRRLLRRDRCHPLLTKP